MKCPTCGGPVEKKKYLNLGLEVYLCNVCFKTFIEAVDIVEAEDEAVVTETVLQEVWI